MMITIMSRTPNCNYFYFEVTMVNPLQSSSHTLIPTATWATRKGYKRLEDFRGKLRVRESKLWSDHGENWLHQKHRFWLLQHCTRAQWNAGPPGTRRPYVSHSDCFFGGEKNYSNRLGVCSLGAGWKMLGFLWSSRIFHVSLYCFWWCFDFWCTYSLRFWIYPEISVDIWWYLMISNGIYWNWTVSYPSSFTPFLRGPCALLFSIKPPSISQARLESERKVTGSSHWPVIWDDD